MKFVLSDGSDFEIPDTWWIECEMEKFVRRAFAYETKPHSDHPKHPIVYLPISLIKPSRRSAGVVLDFGGFDRKRLTRILRGFVAMDRIDPIQVKEKSHGSYEYEIYDGFHRFYASIAANFSELPVIVGNWGFFDSQ